MLNTARLILRPFKLDDAPSVQQLAGDREIASNTLRIPHPYTDGLAEEWIGIHAEQFAEGKAVNYAIVLKCNNYLIGSIGLTIDREHERAELGYWLGKPFWGHGYCTEAGKAVIKYGFDGLNLNRIDAHYLSRNPASGRVMEKLGMKYEGCFREAVKKWDVYEDVTICAILKNEYYTDQ
ncbi:MAG: GNAT family N-acetyltransferase [Candidatus Latescibacteria bacterium]|nr:GNAT family N-acetyltransferase [Candidatus Latescibacterota bacterium]